MESRNAKLALARKKLKDHQEKKHVPFPAEPIPIQDERNTIEDLDKTDPSNISNIIEISNDSPVIQSEIKSSEPKENVMLEPKDNNLWMQIVELQQRYSQLENNYDSVVCKNDSYMQLIDNMEAELSTAKSRLASMDNDVKLKDSIIEEYKLLLDTAKEEKVNLLEQLDFTKTVLTARENEIAAINSKYTQLENQIATMQLRLQQLTNGVSYESSISSPNVTDEVSSKKFAALEQQMQSLQKERDQINAHYEHYVSEINEQLKNALSKNQQLTNDIHILSLRENSLIEQIGTMEIRLQNLQANKNKEKEEIVEQTKEAELYQKERDYTEHIFRLESENHELKQRTLKLETLIQELEQKQQSECDHDNISITKLSADIASDKVAAQRAAEQNKKLKTDLQKLEDDFVKMSRDKLELTEKLTAEKYLNKELTIRLADVEEILKDIQVKLRAKDDEMIRLQELCRELEKQVENVPKSIIKEATHSHVSNTAETTCIEEQLNSTCGFNQSSHVSQSAPANDPTDPIYSTNCNIDKHFDELRIAKEDAMMKLQDRFLKIMGDVADLSDEKHRLEHIITQLQNETDTICEYVALYQQQRSLLKKRDEERNAQIKLFQSECNRLKQQLDELSALIIKLAEDKELAVHFQTELRKKDITKVHDLLSTLRCNGLINSNSQFTELKNLYPCACCSGKLIDV